MKKEKEVCYVYSREFDGEFYVKVEDFKEIIERLISVRGENRKLNEDYKVLGILNDEIRRINENLREENKKLKGECEENNYLVEDNARWMKRCEEKIMEIKKLKETIKDHQLYEEKLEHRIIEFEELLHGE